MQADTHTHTHFTDYTDKWVPLPGGKLNIWICRIKALRSDKKRSEKKEKGKSDNWSAKSSDGKGRDMHSLYSPCRLWRSNGWKGPWSSGLSFFFFLFPFRSCLSVFGGLLGERIRMSVSTPFCPSWDTILSLSCTSAYRGTDKVPRRSEWLYVLVCVSACRLCVGVCVTEAMTSMSLCHPASNLSPQGGRLEGETTRSKTQTGPCP